MADVTVKGLDEFEGKGMRKVRAGLGVSSFGMQVIELPPNFSKYHRHTESEQEEVYTALTGSATLRVGGEEYRLEPGTFARIGPGEERDVVTGEDPVRLLVVGGVPGEAYEAPDFSQESTQGSAE